LIKSVTYWTGTATAIAVMLATGLGGTVAYAEDGTTSDLKSLSLDQLMDVQVTSVSRHPQSLLRTASAIQVITREDIRRSGATSIPEALRLAPGVEVARIDASDWSIGIRGFGSSLTRNVLVLIDGRTVYTPLFAGTNWDVQNTLMDDIDRIEVIRARSGYFSALSAVGRTPPSAPPPRFGSPKQPQRPHTSFIYI
jgi:iron complex outermembrane receptor protein